VGKSVCIRGLLRKEETVEEWTHKAEGALASHCSQQDRHTRHQRPSSISNLPLSPTMSHLDFKFYPGLGEWMARDFHFSQSVAIPAGGTSVHLSGQSAFDSVGPGQCSMSTSTMGRLDAPSLTLMRLFLLASSRLRPDHQRPLRLSRGHRGAGQADVCQH
jgi:hypothetical protein